MPGKWEFIYSMQGEDQNSFCVIFLKRLRNRARNTCMQSTSIDEECNYENFVNVANGVSTFFDRL